MRAKPYFRTRFRVKVSDHETGHWQGGPANYEGASCPVCKKPLLLLWDVNARDPLLLRWNKNRFGGMNRLPLLYCWGCVGDLSYRIVGENRVEVIESTGQANGGAEYEGYPSHFPRKAIELLKGFSPAVKIAIKKWGTDGFAKPGFKETKHYQVLLEFFGHEVFLQRCMFHHQFGGLSLTDTWDDEAFECRNSKCQGKLFDRVRGRKRAMKFLAGVLNDPPHGLPMIEPLDDKTKSDWNYSISVQFHMCDGCYSITAANRCS